MKHQEEIVEKTEIELITEGNAEAFEHVHTALKNVHDFCLRFGIPGRFSCNESRKKSERVMKIEIAFEPNKRSGDFNFSDSKDLQTFWRFFGTPKTVKSLQEDLRNERELRIKTRSELQEASGIISMLRQEIHDMENQKKTGSNEDMK